MAVTAEQVKALREKTGAGIMDCKQALSEANGDFDKRLRFCARRASLRRRRRAAGRRKKDSSTPTSIPAVGWEFWWK